MKIKKLVINYGGIILFYLTIVLGIIVINNSNKILNNDVPQSVSMLHVQK